MSRTISVTVFKFSELEPRVQEKIRARYREMESQDFDPEYVEREGLEVLEAMGFSVSNRRSPTRATIFWSLTPDCAGFDATWRASMVDSEAIAKLRADRPQDTKLHAMLDAMQALAQSAPDAYAVIASGRDGTSPSVESFDYGEGNYDQEYSGLTLSEIVREFCRKFAKAVSAEYDYRMSDEAIDEAIECNDSEYYADGSLVL